MLTKGQIGMALSLGHFSLLCVHDIVQLAMPSKTPMFAPMCPLKGSAPRSVRRQGMSELNAVLETFVEPGILVQRVRTNHGDAAFYCIFGFFGASVRG
jgi:hypothetical protein